MTPHPSPAQPSSRQAAIAARDRHQSRLRTITISAATAGVIATAGVALTLPGSAHASGAHVNSAQHASSHSGRSSSTSSGSSGSSSQGSSGSSSSSGGLSTGSAPSSSSGSGQVTSGGS
jgi:hypothetical protein